MLRSRDCLLAFNYLITVRHTRAPRLDGEGEHSKRSAGHSASVPAVDVANGEGGRAFPGPRQVVIPEDSVG